MSDAHRPLPVFPDLRAFLSWTAAEKDLAVLPDRVDLRHEMTAFQQAALRAGGPVLRFNCAHLDGQPATMPVIGNLFGTEARVAAGLGVRPEGIADLGAFLAALRTPAPVDGWRDALSRWPVLRAALQSRPALVKHAPAQQETAPTDLTRLPVQIPWPGDAGPLITWPVVITRPHGSEARDTARYNLGVYRAQVIGPDRMILRWLSQRGGAAHARSWAAAGDPMPVVVALGADPALLLSAALPLPEMVSELAFSGVLRGARPQITPAQTVPMLAPATAEILIEGFVYPGDTAMEGPFGDHTGYNNPAEAYPVLQVTRITHRRDPLYLTTVTGRPPDEPSVIGGVFNQLALPSMRAQIPELRDLWLPPAACSYRMAVVQIAKRYPGQARRVMMALWGMLAQFSYTKMIVVVDEDINPRNWDDIAWALSTRFDPARDTLLMDGTPMDHLDFSAPRMGLAGKIGLDATTKIGAETGRGWAEIIRPDPSHAARAEAVLRAAGWVA